MIYSCFILLFALAVAATILGWVAITQIRRSAGKLYGMWLAVFDGLLFPLLALDALIVAADLSGRRHVTGPGLTPGVTMAELLIPGWQMLLVLAFIVIVDWLIIRAVWRAVNKPVGGALTTNVPPPVPPRRTNRVFLVFAFGAMVVGSLVTTIWIKFHSQPPAQPPESVQVHYWVFEADAASVDSLIPKEGRKPGVQPGAQSFVPENGISTHSQSVGDFSVVTHGRAQTESQMAEVSPSALGSLLKGLSEKPGSLKDGTRLVESDWWNPGMADGWSYSKADGDLLGGGGANVFWGFRREHGQDEFRVEGDVHHYIDKAGSGSKVVNLQAKILYQGTLPQDNALVFLVPFLRKDDTAHYLVVAIETRKTTTAPTFGPVIERVLPFDRSCIDFQTGKVLQPELQIPAPVSPEEWHAWIKQTGADAMVEEGSKLPQFNADDFPRLVALFNDSCVFVGEDTADFDSVRASDSEARLKVAFEGKFSWDIAHGCSHPWWFRTKDGATGVLQILGTSDKPRGIKLRYKLVQQPSQPGSLANAKGFDQAWDKAFEAIGNRADWPDGPVAVCKAFYEARRNKNYSEMELLWPGSATFNWAKQCASDDPNTRCVFGPPSADGSEVPYTSEDYYNTHHSYNMTMGLGHWDTPKGRRYYIWNGNNGAPRPSPVQTDTTACPNSATLSPEKLAEPPQLRFVAEQDYESNTSHGIPWQPDGAALDPDELKMVNENLSDFSSDLRGLPGGKEARMLRFWFSHPLLKLDCECRMTITDTNGVRIPSFPGSENSFVTAPQPFLENKGWFYVSWAAARGHQLPERVNVSLSYALGPWEETTLVVPVKSEIMTVASLPDGQVNEVGQTVEGKAFVSLARTDDQPQFGFVAKCKDGRTLEPTSTSKFGAPPLRTERYVFDAPIADIKEFHFRKRAFRKVEFKNVLLWPEARAKPPANQTLSFDPVVERVVNDQWAKEGNSCINLDSGKLITARGAAPGKCRLDAQEWR